MNDLDTLVSAAQADFSAAPTPAELENAKARFLGKAGRVTELLKGLSALSTDDKKTRRSPRCAPSCARPGADRPSRGCGRVA